MSAQETPRHTLKKEVQLLLGDQMIEVELDDEHLNLAIKTAIEKIRQRTTGGVEESHVFFTLQPDQNIYTMPEEVVEVEKLFRRGVGANSTGGTNFDPFEAAFSNIYLLQAGRTGGLATWDFFAQYQETIGRVFGSEINFIWKPSSHELELIRRPTTEEDVMAKVWMSKPEGYLLTDTYTGPWIREYATAKAKMMLGEARSKFPGGLPGPGGSVLLNGEQMKSEGMQEMERLEMELQNFVTSRDGMPFRIG
jgi:hypothetical protein